MIIPLMIFFLGWLKWYVSIISIILIIIALFSAFHMSNDEYHVNNNIKISVKSLLLIICISILWCFFAGQGGFFYQSEDHDIRNAIFRDLINFNWPVIYENQNNAMVYYIGQWLVPALVGKIFVGLGEDIGWMAGNIALFIWSSFGIFIVILLMFLVIKVKSIKNIIIAIAVLVLFSGLDIIGIVMQCVTNKRLILVDHIESWSGFWEYSSMTTCLFWVYNQAIVTWIVVLLYLNEKKLNLYAFICLSMLPFAPIPFIGMLPFFLASTINSFIIKYRNNKMKDFFREILSLPNIIAAVTICPIYFLYYLSNAAINTKGFGLSNGLQERGIIKTILIIILFMVLEFGIYAVLIWKKNNKNLNYFVAIISLLIIPIFRIGGASDFSMRASMPSITVLMVLIIAFIQEYKFIMYNNSLHKKLIIRLLIITLIFGAVTPVYEFGRGAYYVYKEKSINLMADTTKSLSEMKIDEIYNFATDNPYDKMFFKYLGRSHLQ
jgi:hypothetical protein